MTEKPSISIIVPVYNAEKYLCKCLDSLLEQTISNIEVICINDGSLDDSQNILQTYASKDRRVIICSQTNQGQGIARNKGLDMARAPFVMFVDSDDYLEKNACEIALKEIQESDVDVVIFCNNLEYADKQIPQYVLGQERRVFTEEETKTLLLRRQLGLVGKELKCPETQDKLSPVCTKIYKTDLIRQHNIRFVSNQTVGPCEDSLFNIDYLLVASKSLYIPMVLYHYIRTNASSSTSVRKEKLNERFDSFFRLVRDRIEAAELSNDQRIQYNKALNNRYAISMIQLGLNSVVDQASFSEQKKRVKELLTRESYQTPIKRLSVWHMKLHWKIFFLLAKCRNSLLLTLLLRIIQKIRQRV